MRKDRLKGHTKEKHPGYPPRILGVVSILDSVLESSTVAKKRRLDQEEAGTSGTQGFKKVKSQDEETLSLEPEQVAIPTASLSPTSPPLSTAEVALVDNVISQPDPPDTVAKDSSPALLQINEKLDTIILNMSKLTFAETKYVPPVPVSTEQKNEEASETHAIELLVKGSKSIDRLCEIANFTVDIENNTITCLVCAADPSKVGVFNYDFTLGTNFCYSNQPRMFINLKHYVARHVSKVLKHQENVNRQAHEEDIDRRDNIKQQSIGLVIGRVAYKLLKCCRPYLDFETDIHLLAAANVNVGTLNHSRKFPSAIKESFAKVLDARIKNFLSTPMEATGCLPPIGIVADKLTTRRRSGQMYAGILFTPGMESLLTPISMGVSMVTQHDGRSIAQDVSDMITR